MFIRVKSILRATPRRRKDSAVFYALQVRQAAKEVLDKVCQDYPQQITKSAKVKSFKNSTLTIVCPQLLSVELHTRSGELKKGINGLLGKDVVEKIRLRGS